MSGPRQRGDGFAHARQIVVRGAIVLVTDAVALLLLSEILPGFVLDGPGTALGIAALVGAFNALVWPALARIALPITVLTLGLGALVLNGIVISIAASILPKAHIAGWGEGVLVTIGVTALTTLFGALFAIDEDDAWARNVVRRQLRRRGAVEESDVPGIVFLEIDGLAHEIVRRALRDGTMPNLARWIRDGGHRLEPWETDLSSQTGACQAGILHGNNSEMPAFRWWDRASARAIVTNHPHDAAEIERRQSDGRGLLHAGGASRANILSGDAPHSMLTMSTVLYRRRPIGIDYAAYFAQPYAAARTLVMAIGEIWRERRAAAHQRRRDVIPRIHRSRTYALVRAWATVVQLDLQVAAVIGDMLAGRPTIYTTFLAYDEVAHHSGIERHDTLQVLAKVDRQLGRIEQALAWAARPYHLVVLADHGQSQGATFRQRYGLTLEELVRETCDAERVRGESGGSDEALAYLSAGLTELGRDEGASARAVRSLTESRTSDGVVTLREDDREALAAEYEEVPELVVMASGCLGLITFPREPRRLTLERIAELYPRLIGTLREHPGIGFALVRSEEHGPLALGQRGVHRLGSGIVEGEDPLAPFGPNARAHLLRTDSFENCPDILVNSTYWEETGEVAAFEELVGSHGGLGGPQSVPFVCFPRALGWPADPVVGAERIHRIFRAWLAELGHDAYRDGAEPLPPSSSESPGLRMRASASGASAAS